MNELLSKSAACQVLIRDPVCVHDNYHLRHTQETEIVRLLLLKYLDA